MVFRTRSHSYFKQREQYYTCSQGIISIMQITIPVGLNLHLINLQQKMINIYQHINIQEKCWKSSHYKQKSCMRSATHQVFCVLAHWTFTIGPCYGNHYFFPTLDVKRPRSRSITSLVNSSRALVQSWKLWTLSDRRACSLSLLMSLLLPEHLSFMKE